MTRVVCISDQHQQEPELPEGDICLNAGDITFGFKGDLVHQQAWIIQKFRPWAQAQPVKHHVVVAGNHDQSIERWGWPAFDWRGEDERWDGIHYLQDAGIELEGLKIWGTPWQPWFYNWAFNAPIKNGEEFLAEKFESIPDDTDIIICHGPPWGACDLMPDGHRPGSMALRDAVLRVEPKLLVCGHIHCAYGQGRLGKTWVVNAALVNERYELTNDPIVIDL